MCLSYKVTEFCNVSNTKQNSLKMMSIHRNMSECFTKQTLLLICSAFVGLNKII